MFKSCFIITPTYATDFDASYDLTLSMARMLVGKGAEIETKDIDGRTPLSLAAADCNESVVRILLDRGANPNSEDNDGRAPLGWTPSLFKSEVKRKARATTFCCTTIRATTICSRKARAITTAGLGHVDQERLDARLTTAHSSPRVVQSFSTTKICSTTKRCGIGRCGPSFSTTNRVSAGEI